MKNDIFKKNDYKNRQKVIAILKDIFINDEIRINKLMLAYDLNIIKVLSENHFNETKRNAFCAQFSKIYGMSINICEQIFDDWCGLLDIENLNDRFKREKDCKDIVNNKLCYLSHFHNIYAGKFVSLYPWFYAIFYNQFERVDLNNDYSNIINSAIDEYFKDIKTIVFESNSDIDKKQGKFIIDEKNINCKLKIVCTNNELRFYTDANKFVIPDSNIDGIFGCGEAFFACLSNLKDIVGLHNICISLNKNLSLLFCDCHSLKTIDVSKWDTMNVTNTVDMFNGCLSLETIDVSKWDTRNVTNMSGMFARCVSLKTIDVSQWDTSKVTDMSGMFSYCNSLKAIDVSNWDISNVTNMFGMFLGCKSLETIAVSKWDTRNVTNMSGMFAECKSLETIDVSKWDENLVREIRSIRFLEVKNYSFYIDENKSYIFQWAFKQFKNSFHFPHKCDLLVKIINEDSEKVYECKYVITESHYGYWTYKDGHTELLGTIYIERDKIRLRNSKVGKIEYIFSDENGNWSGSNCKIENLPLKEISISLQNELPILVSDKINKEYRKSDDKKDFIFNDWKGQIEKINFKYINSHEIKYEIVFKLLKLINYSSEAFINYKIKRKKDKMILADGSIYFGSMEKEDKKLVKGSIIGEDFNLNDEYIFCIDW